MRAEFFDELLSLARDDDRIVVLTGDLGFSVLEPFAQLGERFVNVGVAEQNMLGIATGLAEAGYIPYAYSISTFASLRGYEFIRNGAVLHRLPVRIVGGGSGFDYGHNGVSHYALEDIAVMHAQPGITVIAPADSAQVRPALRAVHEIEGPAYIRLGREATPVDGLEGRFRLGRIETIGAGDDVAILALGSMAREAVEGARLLEQAGIHATVGVVSSVRPTPSQDIADLASRSSLVVTLEAHYADGGLGSIVAGVLAEHQVPTRLARFAVQSVPVGVTGSPSYLLHRHELDGRSLAANVSRELERSNA